MRNMLTGSLPRNKWQMAIEAGLTLQVSVTYSYLLLLFCDMYFYCLFCEEQT